MRDTHAASGDSARIAPRPAPPRRERHGAVSAAERTIRPLLERAGLEINGHRDFDPKIRDTRLFARVLRDGTLGLGEAWMDEWWDCEALDEMFARLVGAGIDGTGLGGWRLTAMDLLARLRNLQRKPRARGAITRHYDQGDDLFEAMLDRRRVYSCAYWEGATDLDDAQEKKLEFVCQKLGISHGHHVLDIGCGWGGFAQWAAERHGARVTGATISPSQAADAREACRGLPVEILLRDYRDLSGRFDRIVSIGMFEHVGPKNHRAFMEHARRLLAGDGLMLLQTIGGTRSFHSGEPWLGAYIFPDAVVPSIAQIGRSIEGLFVMEDWHELGAFYDRTLMAWHANVEARWEALPRYDRRFRRMWRYYLLHCAGAFRARKNQLWHIVLSPRGVPGGYRAIRG